jgi:hypothetical protein
MRACTPDLIASSPDEVLVLESNAADIRRLLDLFQERTVLPDGVRRVRSRGPWDDGALRAHRGMTVTS